MRVNIAAVVVGGALALACSGVAGAQAVVGKEAPPFSGIDTNGQSRSLSDFKGKWVVLEWTNHECPFVKKHYGSGNMQKTQKDATSKGVTWLSIISSAPGKQGYVDAQTANGLTKERGAAPTAVILDGLGTIGKAYGAKTTPHMFVINPSGTLVYNGAIDDIASSDASDIAKAKNYVSLGLNEAMAGKAVTTATSQPYGCSVKY